MLCFEMCPRCCHVHQLSPERLKPMVLSGDDKEMQCDVCNHSFKLPDSESVIEMARQQRAERYGLWQCGCGEWVPNGVPCFDCDLMRDLLEAEGGSDAKY